MPEDIPPLYIERNGEVLFQKQHTASCEKEEECLELTLRKVYDFALNTPLDEISFILETARLNKAAAERSFEGNYGHGWVRCCVALMNISDGR